MRSAETRQTVVKEDVQPADDQQSWSDGAVPLRRGVDHEERLRIVPSSPRAAFPRGLAVAGLCSLVLGLAAVVMRTLNDGADPQLQTNPASENHEPVNRARRADRVPADRRATHRKPELRGQRQIKHGKRDREHTSPASAHPTPSTDPSTPAPVAPTTVPSPPLSTPSSEQHPEFGL
jgi:hypothetical protein